MRKKALKTLAAVVATVSMLSTSMVVFAAESYTVEKNDYLRKIAKQAYGDGEKWEIIYEANKEQISNPNLIYAGQVLTIPDLDSTTEAPVATQAPTALPVQEPVPVTQAPTALPVQEPAPVTQASTDIMSAEDASMFVAMLYSSVTTELPDSVLSFFDVDGNMTIDINENNDCFFWLIDNYNPQKKRSLSLLSNEEKIAIATAMNNGGVKPPYGLFHTTR